MRIPCLGLHAYQGKTMDKTQFSKKLEMAHMIVFESLQMRDAETICTGIRFQPSLGYETDVLGWPAVPKRAFKLAPNTIVGVPGRNQCNPIVGEQMQHAL